MTLPTTTTVNGCDDDSDMFGPPRSSPIGYHHHRSRVPMISPKLRQREERKRILQLCAHKLERIKDSETNLRRSVCINNTYCRLTDELRREKQSRYLANLPRWVRVKWSYRYLYYVLMYIYIYIWMRIWWYTVWYVCMKNGWDAKK